jgi:hypothetical protein
LARVGIPELVGGSMSPPIRPRCLQDRIRLAPELGTRYGLELYVIVSCGRRRGLPMG